ncbi:hypothetical protein Tco_1133963 [Tanacetum coccineum]
MVITLKWIYKVKLDERGEIRFRLCDPVDTPMVEKSKLDEDKEGKSLSVLDADHGLFNIPDSTHIDSQISLYQGSMFEKMGVIEDFNFCQYEYQLADIFTKALGRERIEFLINKLGMRSFTPETLKQLADEVDE